LRAVAFIIFDRPELTKRVFEKIRSAMTDGVAGRSRGQRAKPLKHDEKLSLYSGARRDWRKNWTLKIFNGEIGYNTKSHNCGV
jgi:hypothetical protein